MEGGSQVIAFDLAKVPLRQVNQTLHSELTVPRVDLSTTLLIQ